MMTLRVPIIAVVIGEGGSGGALGIGVADRVLILENAYYSVISPGGLLGDFVAGSATRAGSGRSAETDRAGFAEARGGRRNRARAGRRRASRL